MTREDQERTIAMLAGRGALGRLARWFFAWPRRLVGGKPLLLLALSLPAGLLGCGEEIPPGCSVGDAVPERFQREVLAAADTLFLRIRAQDSAGIFEHSASRLREKSTEEEFVGRIALAVAHYGVPDRFDSHRMILFHRVPGVPFETPVACADEDSPDYVGLMLLEDPPVQMSLVQEATVNGRRMRYSTLWLQEDGRWNLGAFRPRPLDALGRPAAAYEETADAQMAAGNRRNALLLYRLAADLVEPNPWTRTAEGMRIEGKIKELGRMAGLAVTGLGVWDVDGTVYRVKNQTCDISGDRLGMALQFEVGPGTPEATMNESAQALWRYLERDYPEYAAVFHTLTVDAVVKDAPVAHWEFPLRTGSR